MGKKEKLIQLNCLLEKLYTIDSQLGGTAKKQNDTKGQGGEFENIHLDCKERIFKLKNTYKELDDRLEKFGRDKVFILREAEARTELVRCEDLLKEMDKVLSKQAKNKNVTKPDLARRDKLYNSMKRETYLLMKARGMNVPDDSFDNDKTNDRILTMEQLKFNATRSDEKSNPNRQNINVNADEREMQAIGNFKKVDEEQDEIIGRIGEKVDVLHIKAKEMGGKIDHVGVKVGEVTANVNVTQNQLDTQNQRLKVLLTKYRQPGKFCLDITFILLLIGLIAVLYKMLG